MEACAVRSLKCKITCRDAIEIPLYGKLLSRRRNTNRYTDAIKYLARIQRFKISQAISAAAEVNNTESHPEDKEQASGCRTSHLCLNNNKTHHSILYFYAHLVAMHHGNAPHDAF